MAGFDSRWVRLGSGAKARYTSSGADGPAVVPPVENGCDIEDSRVSDRRRELAARVKPRS